MDNPKVIAKDSKFGKGLFAITDLKQGEIISSFDGQEYIYPGSGWTEHLHNHVIEIAERRYRDSLGFATLINHSCVPNTGFDKEFNLVTMRPVQNGEELFLDYDLTGDDDDWHMQCHCGTPMCRRVVGEYKLLPQDLKIKYKEYTPSWLLQKYGLQ